VDLGAHRPGHGRVGGHDDRVGARDVHLDELVLVGQLERVTSYSLVNRRIGNLVGVYGGGTVDVGVDDCAIGDHRACYRASVGGFHYHCVDVKGPTAGWCAVIKADCAPRGIPVDIGAKNIMAVSPIGPIIYKTAAPPAICLLE